MDGDSLVGEVGSNFFLDSSSEQQSEHHYHPHGQSPATVVSSYMLQRDNSFGKGRWPNTIDTILSVDDDDEDENNVGEEVILSSEKLIDNNDDDGAHTCYPSSSSACSRPRTENIDDEDPENDLEEEDDEEEEDFLYDDDDPAHDETIIQVTTFLKQRRSSLGEGRWQSSSSSKAYSTAEMHTSPVSTRSVLSPDYYCSKSSSYDFVDDGNASHRPHEPRNPFLLFEGSSFESMSSEEESATPYFPCPSVCDTDTDTTATTTVVRTNRYTIDTHNQLIFSPFYETLLHSPTTVESLEYIVQQNPSILFIKDRTTGHLPLHTAIAHNKSSYILSFLLDHDWAAITIPDANGNLPIHLAASHVYSKPIPVLPAPASLTSRQQPPTQMENDTTGMTTNTTSTHHSTTNEDLDLLYVNRIRLIYEAYPEGIFVPNNEGQLPLHLAYNNYYVAQYLLEQFPEAIWEMDSSNKLPFHVAIEQNADCSVINLLYNEFPNAFYIPLNTNDSTLPIQMLLENCAREEEDGLSLISNQIDDAQGDSSCIMSTCNTNAFDVLQIMVQHEANCLRHPIRVNFSDETSQSTCKTLPLHLVCQLPNTPNATGYSPELIQYLAHVYPDALLQFDEFGFTPFHWWCSNSTYCNRSTSLLEVSTFLSLQPDCAILRTQAPDESDNDVHDDPNYINNNEEFNSASSTSEESIVVLNSVEMLPLFLACENDANLDVVYLLVQRSLNEIFTL